MYLYVFLKFYRNTKLTGICRGLAGELKTVFFSLTVKDLREELEKQESSLRKFGAVTHQLLKECHPSVSDSLNNALKDVNAR